MNDVKRFGFVVFLCVAVFASACNLPTATSTPASSTDEVATGTGSEEGVSAITQTGPSGQPISVDVIANVNDIALDPAGNVWAATFAGVVKCDAALQSCESITKADGLADDEVNAISVAPDGSYWFGTMQGLSQFKDGNWTTYTTDDGLVANTVFDLKFSLDGALWISTNSGLSHFEGGTWTDYTSFGGLLDDYVYCVDQAQDGALWFGTSRGASRFDGTNWYGYDQDIGLPASDVLSITSAADGALWLGTLFGGVARFDGSDWQIYTLSEDMSANVVQAMSLDRDEALWLGTRAGAFRFDGNEWLGYTTAEGLRGNDVLAVAAADDGSVYFGTDLGITRFTAVEINAGVVQSVSPPASSSTLPEGDPIAHFTAGAEVVIQSIHMSDADLGWAIGGSGENGDHVLHTADSGLTWLDVTPPEPAPLSVDAQKMASGFFIDEEAGWVVYHSFDRESELDSTELGIWRTVDAGQSWQWSGPISVDFVGSIYNPAYLDFSSTQNGWIMNRLGGVGMHKYPIYLFGTKDGGANWTRLVDAYESDYLRSCSKTGMDFTNGSTGWVTIANCPIEGAEVVVTGDGGVTWDELALPAPDTQPDLFSQAGCESHSPTLFSTAHGALAMSCVRWEDEDRIEEHYLYISQDGGGTWQTHSYPGGTLIFIEPNIAYAMSRDIYRTLDGGVSWIKVKSVSWDGQFSFINQQQCWAVARSEADIALVRTENGGQSWSIIEPTIASQ